MSSVPSQWFDSEVAADLSGQAAELLRAEFGDSVLFVVKDPRICRLVPFWRSALERLEVEPCFVIPIRNPAEVAASLEEFSGMAFPRGILLWLSHSLEAERETRTDPRVVLSYDDLLSDWSAVARRISDALEISWPRWTRGSESEIERFLTSAHRHHQVSEAELEARPDIAESVKATYSIFERAADSGELDTEQLDAIGLLLADAGTQ